MALIAWWQSYVTSWLAWLIARWQVESTMLGEYGACIGKHSSPPHTHPAHDPQKMLHCHQVQFFKLLLSHGSDLIQIKIRPPCLNSCLSRQEKVKAVSEDVLPIQSWTVPLAYRSLLPLHFSGSDLSWLSQLRFNAFFVLEATETYWFHMIFVHRQRE